MDDDMNALERQIAEIGDRAEMHKFVDEQPDDTDMLVITRTLSPCPEHPNGENGCRGHQVYSYRQMGGLEPQDCLWLAQSFTHFLMT